MDTFMKGLYKIVLGKEKLGMDWQQFGTFISRVEAWLGTDLC